MKPATKLAPIALFAYNRPSHTRQTVEALRANNLAGETDLVVFCDGPREGESTAAVGDVRAYVREIDGFNTVTIIEHDINLGLANSIIAGVTRVCGEYGRVIVLEDDLVTAPTFLSYMNEALALYEGDEDVGSIHGYWYDVDTSVPETFFLRGASCWGWATWSRAWAQFEPDGRKLLVALQQQGLTRLFDLGGSIGYTRMLKDQIAGRNDSWAIRWHASMFLANRLQLSPGKSLVRNIGFDGSGTHCAESAAYAVNLAIGPINVRRVPVEQSDEARAALIRYYRRTKRSLPARAIGRLRRVIGW